MGEPEHRSVPVLRRHGFSIHTAKAQGSVPVEHVLFVLCIVFAGVTVDIQSVNSVVEYLISTVRWVWRSGGFSVRPWANSYSNQ